MSACHGHRHLVAVEDETVVMRCSCGETFDLPRCLALKRDKARCPAFALEGSHYCRTHSPSVATGGTP